MPVFLSCAGSLVVGETGTCCCAPLYEYLTEDDNLIRSVDAKDEGVNNAVAASLHRSKQIPKKQQASLIVIEAMFLLRFFIAAWIVAEASA